MTENISTTSPPASEAVPDKWPPEPGEVWRTHSGALWFVVSKVAYFGCHMRDTADVLAPADYVNDTCGPTTRVYPRVVANDA